MKRNFSRLIALLVCIALVCVTTVVIIFASENEKFGKNAEATAPEDKVTLTDKAENAPEKNETVYVIANTDGSVKKLIVSDWLKNVLGDSKLGDTSSLSGIQNVKGDESYTTNSYGIVWNADGNDIYYQGTIEKELPVRMKISFKLDGKDISAADITGKSGKVVIRFDYENNQYENVEIDGKQEKIYVPFAMLTGMLLDNDVFTNIQVSNGKLANDGDRIAVVGIAFPGMNENLALDTEKFDIPDYVEITADVKGFTLGSTVSVATNGIFNNIDTGCFDKLDELDGKLGELTDAVNSLMNGSSQLYDGVCILLDKSGELVAGINQLAEGAQKLKDGSAQLKNGSAEAAQGAADLSDGLHQITANNEKMNDGAATVFALLLKTADNSLVTAGITGIPALTVENYNEVLTGVVASLAEDKVREQATAVALNQVTAEVNANRELITAAVTAAVRDEVEKQVTAVVRADITGKVLATMGMTPETYQAGINAGVITSEQQAAVNAAVDTQMESDQARAAITANTDSKMADKTITDMIKQKTDEQVNALIAENMESEEVTSAITAAAAKAQAGALQLKYLMGQLDSYKEFYNGIIEYTAGVSAACDGADKLKTGTAALSDGCVALDSGMNDLLGGILTMKDNVPALVSGVEQLKDGSMQLCDGLAQFNEKGIEKLTEAVNGNIAGLVTRVRATVDVSKSYTSFSGIDENMDGNVKFIYRTESIK